MVINTGNIPIPNKPVPTPAPEVPEKEEADNA